MLWKIIANLFPKTIYYSDASIKIDNFEQFYSKNSVETMFKFLDEDSSFFEELNIILYIYLYKMYKNKYLELKNQASKNQAKPPFPPFPFRGDF